MKENNYILRLLKKIIIYFIQFQFSIFLFIVSCGSLTSIDYYKRIQAVDRINNQEVLINLALNDADWRIRNAAFDKLNKTSLLEIGKLAKDTAIIIAARILLKQTTWGEEFFSTSLFPDKISYVIGAVALVNFPQPTLYNINTLCRKYISKPCISRIPEMRFILLRYGNKALAEDYLNCGEKALLNIACEWGRMHGYDVRKDKESNRIRYVMK